MAGGICSRVHLVNIHSLSETFRRDHHMEDEGSIREKILQQSLHEVRSSGCAAEPCVICLEPISEGATTRPCHHHNFDYICLLSWLEQQPTCPLCKSAIKSIEYSDPAGRPCVYKVPQASQLTARASYHGHSSTRGGPGSLLAVTRRRRPRYPTRSLESSHTSGDALARRRRVYRNQLYSLHIGSNRISAYQNLTPERFSAAPALATRARSWIRRELEVFTFLHRDDAGQSESSSEPSLRNINNAFFLLEYIVAILKSIDIKASSGQAQTMLSDYLGRQNAQLFLHELESFLRSPYESLDAWDRHVQYPVDAPQSGEQPSSVQGRKRPHEPSIVPPYSSERASQNGTQRYTSSHDHKRRLLDRYVPD